MSPVALLFPGPGLLLRAVHRGQQAPLPGRVNVINADILRGLLRYNLRAIHGGSEVVGLADCQQLGLAKACDSKREKEGTEWGVQLSQELVNTFLH